MPATLRLTLLFSAGLHLACFGIFQPTFGHPLQKVNFSQFSFLGPILKTGDFSFIDHYRSWAPTTNIGKDLRHLRSNLSIKKGEVDFLTFKTPALKPCLSVASGKKTPPISEVTPDILPRPRKEPTIVFHPPLPYSFLLYFQDRQVAHIEFMFYISENGKITSLKRKISSGNLDADLLSLRYIAHCLNLIEGKYPAQTWQKVEIDLARKND